MVTIFIYGYFLRKFPLMSMTILSVTEKEAKKYLKAEYFIDILNP